MKPSLALMERMLFFVLLALNLVPLWSVHYFLTGDGPCHLYNAKVLVDFFQGGDAKAFYAPWMYLNTALEPNWFGHATMAGLMSLGFQPYLAEKFLQTFYVLAFGLGLRFMIRQLNPNGLFLSTFGLLLSYHFVFLMGFYNYTCSLAIMLWVTGYWLKYRQNWTTGRILIQALGWLVLYFCHPIGLLISFLIIGSVLVTELGIHWYRENQSERSAYLKSFWKNTLAMLLAALPVLLLFAEYIVRKGLNPSPRSESSHRMWVDFREFSALSIISSSERFWAIGIAVLFLLMAIWAVTSMIKRRTFRWTDALFVVFVLLLLLYFFQPGGVAGAGVLAIRLQLLPYLTLLLWLSTIDFAPKAQKAVLGLTSIIFIAFLIIRMPHYRLASEAAEEIVSAASVIPDHVSVLPLSFDLNGLAPNGKQVSDRIWLFMHAGDYIGTERTVVMLGNYEAATHNFPLIWNPERNPFELLGKDGGYFEGQPPIANLLDYPQKSNHATIDYVVTWCLDQQKFGEHPFVLDMKRQLEQGYDWIFTSKSGLVKVFRRKN